MQGSCHEPYGCQGAMGPLIPAPHPASFFFSHLGAGDSITQHVAEPAGGDSTVQPCKTPGDTTSPCSCCSLGLGLRVVGSDKVMAAPGTRATLRFFVLLHLFLYTSPRPRWLRHRNSCFSFFCCTRCQWITIHASLVPFRNWKSQQYIRLAGCRPHQ